MSPPANPPGASNQRKRRFPYTPVACEACQRRKIKCSGAQPCERCRDSNITCSYERTTRFRSGYRGFTGNIQGNAAARARVSPEGPDMDEGNNVDAENAQNRRAISPRPAASGPGSFDYYIRLAESRLTKKSSVQATRPRTESRRWTLAGAHHLQQVYFLRKSKNAGKGLNVFDADAWTEILQTYDEEIGLQYPFLDIELFTERIRAAKQDMLVASPLSPSKEGDIQYVQDIACLILSLVAYLADPDVAEVAEPLVQEIFGPSLSRVHLGEVEDVDLYLLILTSMFLFLSDQEIQAWRCIGTVMRLVQEMCSLEPENREKKVSDKLYWTVYTLDRRWGFGTGLPFGVSDADVKRQPYALDDGNLSSAYLKQMVSYCGIASEVRRKLLSQSSPENPSINQDSTRDYVNFRLVQWQNDLPPRLRFGGVGDKLDPARERRGHYRLRLLLYLRASQMRTIILRKSVASSGLTSLDSSSMQAMLDIAQDTIHVLIYLARETDIYHAQQRTFNHFLETALSSLLLFVCSNGFSSSASCLSDVVAAIELIRQLSQDSKITRKLHEKLQIIQQVVDGLKTRDSSIGPSDALLVRRVPSPDGTTPQPLDQQTPPLRQEGPALSIGGLSRGPKAAEAGLEIHDQPAQQWSRIADLSRDSSTDLSSAYQGFVPYDQHRSSMNMNNILPNVFTIPQVQPTSSDNSSSHVAAMPGQIPAEMYNHQVMVDSQLRDLGEILMDYEYFAF